MMNKPTLSQVMASGMESKYTMVMAIAKRARRIAAGEPPLIITDVVKPVSIAAYEVAKNRITVYNRTDDDEPEK